MDDSELAAIRAARLAELQARGGGGASNGGATPSRSSGILAAFAPAARERLERVRMVKPDRAALLESHVAQHYRGGTITEADVVSLLKQLEGSSGAPKIQFLRKEVEESDSDSDFA